MSVAVSFSRPGESFLSFESAANFLISIFALTVIASPGKRTTTTATPSDIPVSFRSLGIASFRFWHKFTSIEPRQVPLD